MEMLGPTDGNLDRSNQVVELSAAPSLLGEGSSPQAALAHYHRSAKTMKNRSFFAVSLLVSVTLNAQTNVRVDMQRQEWNENLADIRLQFNSEADRRYLIEVSQDLFHWESHYLAPFEPCAEGYWIRQLEMTNPYTPKAEFYRVSKLPWRFQTIDDSGDWIGDLFLASNGSEAFLVYQNRDTNTLLHSVSDQNGRFGPPSVIGSTCAVGEPGFWDNSGFDEVTLLHYGGVLYLVCTDDIAKKVIILRKQGNSTEWTRYEISGVIDAHYWAFPKFAISSSGILGVAYRSNEGTMFSYANHSTPELWSTVLVTSDTPDSSSNLKTKFSTESHANIFIKYCGSFLVATEDGSVSSESYPGAPPNDLSPEEMESIESTTRNETVSNHVRLQDDRIVIALTNARRVIVAVENEESEQAGGAKALPRAGHP